MPRKTRRFSVEIDERTEHMSLEALRCRTFGHAWIERTVAHARRMSLAKLGQVEEILGCERCGGTWETIYALPDFTRVSTKRTYADPGTYLVPPRSGRLRRHEARKALYCRRAS